MRWEEWLDRVQVSVTGSQAERVLWDWNKTGGRLGWIRPCMGGFTAWTSRRQYEALEKIALKRNAQIKTLKVRGLGRWLSPYHSRLGLVLGPVLFLAAVQLTGNFVWSVEYFDFTPEQKVLVEEKLLETGLQEGQLATQEKLRQAEQELMSQTDAFGWVSLNFVDGRLTAECTSAMEERTFPQANQWDLIAAVDGVILSQDISLGFTQTRVGDTVKQGQVLVSCYKLDHDSQPVWQETYGQVIAEFSREYSWEQPLKYTASLPRPGISCWTRLWTGNFYLTLSGREEEGEGWTEYQPLTFWGLALPGTLVTTWYPQYEEETFSLSAETAAEFARYQCVNQLLEEFPDARILTEEARQELEDGVLRYQWTVKARADIARPSQTAPVIETPVE